MVQVKAGFWFRLAAFGLDLALFVPLYYAAVYSITHLSGRPAIRRLWDQTNPVLMSALVGNAMWLIYSSLEWITGASPGKMILRMRITTIDGGPAPRGSLFVRWLMKNGVRVCGLLDVLPTLFKFRMALAVSSLGIFYHEPLNFTLIRYLGELLALVVAAGFFLILLPDGQSLHDRLAGTAVYRRVAPLGKTGFQISPKNPPPQPVQPLEDRMSGG